MRWCYLGDCRFWTRCQEIFGRLIQTQFITCNNGSIHKFAEIRSFTPMTSTSLWTVAINNTVKMVSDIFARVSVELDWFMGDTVEGEMPSLFSSIRTVVRKYGHPYINSAIKFSITNLSTNPWSPIWGKFSFTVWCHETMEPDFY